MTATEGIALEPALAYVGPPRSDQQRGTCPRCGTVAVHLSKSTGMRVDGTTQVYVATCHYCGKGTVVVERGRYNSQAKFELIEPVMWWPTPNAAELVDPDASVPAKAIDAYGEGLRCLAVQAPNAAAGRFRTALAVIANDKGGAEVQAERTLTIKLKRLYESNPLLIALGEHTDTIKVIGDAGTHQEEWPSITLEQAALAGQLTWHLIEALYVFPARMVKSRPERGYAG